jgi:hypothetical protein
MMHGVRLWLCSLMTVRRAVHAVMAAKGLRHDFGEHRRRAAWAKNPQLMLLHAITAITSDTL